MDARILRELELDRVASLYAPPGMVEAGTSRTPRPAAEAIPEQIPVRALFVEGLDWLVVAGGQGAGPFAGAEGKLVDGMLAAVGGRRGEGAPVEVAEGLARRPRIVLALGEAAARELVGASGPVEGLRGQAHPLRDGIAVVTFHPAELLDACEKKAFAWEDLLFARRSAQKA